MVVGFRFPGLEALDGLLHGASDDLSIGWPQACLEALQGARKGVSLLRVQNWQFGIARHPGGPLKCIFSQAGRQLSRIGRFWARCAPAGRALGNVRDIRRGTPTWRGQVKFITNCRAVI